MSSTFEQFDSESTNKDLALALCFYRVGKSKICADCATGEEGIRISPDKAQDLTCSDCDKHFDEILADLQDDAGDEINLSALTKMLGEDEQKKEKKPKKAKVVSNVSSKGFVDSMSISETRARAYANLLIKKECNIDKIKDDKIILPKEAKAIEQEILTIEEDEIVLSKEEKEQARLQRIASIPSDDIVTPEIIAERLKALAAGKEL